MECVALARRRKAPDVVGGAHLPEQQAETPVTLARYDSVKVGIARARSVAGASGNDP